MSEYSDKKLNHLTRELSDELNEIISRYQRLHGEHGFNCFAALARCFLDNAEFEAFKESVSACEEHTQQAVMQNLNHYIDWFQATLNKARGPLTLQLIERIEMEREQQGGSDHE